MVADNPDSAGDFHANGDEIAARVQSADYFPEQLYHPDDEFTDAEGNLVTISDQLLLAWSAGDYRFVNYDGHGAKTSLGKTENFVTVEDVPGLNNGSALPIFAALTCAAGNSAYPGILSLADSLVLAAAGGSIAAFAPTGLSLDEFAHEMNVEFVDIMLGADGEIGAAHQQASQPVLRGVQIPDFMRDIYHVQGDPAVRVVR